MNNTLSKIVIFAAGAAIGSAVTWKLLKEKYEQIAQEEIESVKEVYGGRPRYEGPADSEEEQKVDQNDIREYAAQIQKQGYTDYANNAKPRTEVSEVKAPYVIEPEEFGEKDGYDRISLTYYADGVLTDDQDAIVEDVDDVVGIDSLDHFGEYEDDSVFVRNDRLKADYEILLDPRKYQDINKKPHPAEGK